MRASAQVRLQVLGGLRRSRIEVPLQQDQVPLHRHGQRLQRGQRLPRRRQLGRIEM